MPQECLRRIFYEEPVLKPPFLVHKGVSRVIAVYLMNQSKLIIAYFYVTELVSVFKVFFLYHEVLFLIRHTLCGTIHECHIDSPKSILSIVTSVVFVLLSSSARYSTVKCSSKSHV